jgi:predicted deacylase
MGLYSQIEIRSGKQGPAGLIIAGVHGDEYEPIMAILQLQDQLKKVLETGTLTLVPVVNQEAFFRMSRTGSDAKDLARTCPGLPDGTVTDKIAFQISNLIRESDFLIDLHTGGNIFKISPLAGYMLHSDESVLKVQRAMAKAFNLPIMWGTSHELEGRTLSVARDALKPAIYTESGGGCYDQERVKDLVKGCLNVMTYFGMVSRSTKEIDKVKYVVEDYRKASGHLQVMYPSPKKGVFVPLVNLGQKVYKGRLLGEVFDLNGQMMEKIHAEEDGLVFLIRALPPVCEGEALAGILPITKEGTVKIK